MNNTFKVVIPARYESTRLAGKLLLDIAGKPLIQHAYESACGSMAAQVVIATDDRRIRDAVESFGGEVIMTSGDHKSGTDRIAEAVATLDIDDEMVIVNIQGDEYGLPPAIVDQLSHGLSANHDIQVATLCEKIICNDNLMNPNVVKVVMDNDNSAMYFSRFPIPWQNNPGETPVKQMTCQPYRHIGIYAYRAGFLKIYSSLPHCPLEDSEKLEQLRVLYHGYKIHIEEACMETGMEINTAEDLDKARKMVK